MRASRPLHSRTSLLAVPTRGFTLIELMVTLAVAAIMIGIAVPSFQSVVNSNKLASAANEMVASLQLARMEAVRRNVRAAVCASANANAGADATCASADINGWITFVDENGDGDFDSASDTLLRNSMLEVPMELTFSPNFNTDVDASIVFRPDGWAREDDDGIDGNLFDGVIRFCLPVGRPRDNARDLEIESGSRMVILDEDNDVCDAPGDPA